MKTLLALALALAATTATAQPTGPGGKAQDAGARPPQAPVAAAVDKSPRCETRAVNECRSSCDTRRYDLAKPAEVDRKRAECRQDCIRGC